jgi:hypothetical protein
MRRIPVGGRCKGNDAAVKMLRHTAPEMFAIFANIAEFAIFDGFKSSIGWHEEHAEALRPLPVRPVYPSLRAG